MIRKYLLSLILTLFVVSALPQTTIVVITSHTNYYGQVWKYFGSGNPLDTQWIKEQWAADKYITSIGYTSHGWFIAMNNGVKWTRQSYKHVSSSWPDSYVYEQKEKGYMITSLAASDTDWFVVTSANTGYTDQKVCSAPYSTLATWIKTQWDSNYRITSIACQNSLWTIVMSKGTSYDEQVCFFANSSIELTEKEKEYWDKGYRISACNYGGGQYFCIMSKTAISAITQQRIFTHMTESPSSFISDGWNQNMNITYIGG